MLENGALTGIKVLDLSRLLPGPFCSMILADHGAEVIAIEDKRFQADGLFLRPVNRNKKHMSLNLKTDAGKEIFFKLAKEADVILEGFRPGVVDRLGIGYPAVQKINQRIIYCAVTGYGQTGPLRDRAGHDVNYLALAGVLDQIGEKDRPPVIPGVQLADIAGGGMYGAIGILLALLARERTGRGQYIDISMTDGMVSLLPIPLFFKQLLGTFPKRSDGMLSHRYACYNTYETADGRYLSVGAVESRFWSRLCNHFRVPEFIPLQYDEPRREEIIAFFRTNFRKKTLAEWQPELAELDACCEPVLHPEEVMEADLFRERKMIIEMPQKEDKSTPTLGVPVKLSDTPGSVRTPPVEFGANTREVLKSLGYSDTQIDSLLKAGVI
ncbi:MAG: CaiB/BaiF CoA transferase family protein [Thermodesulfobacteriota bacterium]